MQADSLALCHLIGLPVVLPEVRHEVVLGCSFESRAVHLCGGHAKAGRRRFQATTIEHGGEEERGRGEAGERRKGRWWLGDWWMMLLGAGLEGWG